MSQSPNAAAPAAATPDWRKSVLQSYRNSEVREISKVLAALEGSASVTPASKMMLAMRFEDQIFKSAKDLADYRKKISKRLKKLQKNYKKPQPQSPQQATTSNDDDKEAEARQELTIKLKRDYGDELRYITTNAAAAVADIKRKLGSEKARQLQQHTDSCRVWARDLGILTEEELNKIPSSSNFSSSDDTNKEGGVSSTEESPKDQSKKDESLETVTTQQSSARKPNNKANPLSFSQLQRIEKHLQTRVNNIRSYVVKHADPDQFLLETLQAKDESFAKNTAAGNLFRDVLKGMQRRMLRGETAAAAANSSNNNNAAAAAAANPEGENDDASLALQKALEKAMAVVPMSTRNDDKKLEVSLRYLDKMRAASTAMMNYWTFDGDQRLATAPRETLKKIHEVVLEGADFVLKAVKELEQQKKQQQGRYNNSAKGDSNNTAATASDDAKVVVSLQDAWSKTIELPSAAAASVEDEENTGNNSNNNSPNKRPRTNSYRPYYKTRMLFRSNRKTPKQLIHAIRRKGANLKQVGNDNAIHLVLQFGNAFCMTIYFSPLTVTLRAKANHENDSDDDDSNSNTNSAAPWKPLSHGLTPWGETLDSGDFLRNKNINDQQQQLSVWGVTANYESIGRVVEERLRDASTHATAVLRNCFRNRVKDKTVDYEVEMLEGSALLEFLQVARETYMPQWEDIDV